MNNLYHVKGYNFRSNEWWRVIVTATDEEAAKKMLREYAPGLTDLYAMYVCKTPDELFLEF